MNMALTSQSLMEAHIENISDPWLRILESAFGKNPICRFSFPKKLRTIKELINLYRVSALSYLTRCRNGTGSDWSNSLAFPESQYSHMGPLKMVFIKLQKDIVHIHMIV